MSYPNQWEDPVVREALDRMDEYRAELVWGREYPEPDYYDDMDDRDD